MIFFFLSVRGFVGVCLTQERPPGPDLTYTSWLAHFLLANTHSQTGKHTFFSSLTEAHEAPQLHQQQCPTLSIVHKDSVRLCGFALRGEV